MNWQEIQRDCPKAYRKWTDYYEGDTYHELTLDLIGYLFTFFDEQGIRLFTYTVITRENDKDVIYWWYNIYGDNIISKVRRGHRCKTRLEAWQEGFKKCFELLEKEV